MAKKGNEIQKIKAVFVSLDTDHKIEAREKIARKFGVTQESVNNRWLYEEKIPEGNIQGVATIIKSVANKQLKKLQKQILDCI